MSTLMSHNNTILLNNLLTIYDKVMVLKIFIDSVDDTLKRKYQDATSSHNHNLETNPQHIDAGFDLFAPGNENNNPHFGDDLEFYGPGWGSCHNAVNKLDLKVCCSAKIFTDREKNFNTGYYMYPRSSLSKTQLRLANSVGIIDAGYRGHLMGMFDVVNIESEQGGADYHGQKYDRYLQICAPGLIPIVVQIVNTINELGDETVRGGDGFGSSGR